MLTGSVARLTILTSPGHHVANVPIARSTPVRSAAPMHKVVLGNLDLPLVKLIRICYLFHRFSTAC